MSEKNKVPQRGEIWLVKFLKAKETPKPFRPVLVISNNIQNELDTKIVVVPITTEDIENIEPFEVFIKNTSENGLDYPSKIQFIYPLTIDKELRLLERLGVVNKEEITEKIKVAWKIAFDWDNF